MKLRCLIVTSMIALLTASAASQRVNSFSNHRDEILPVQTAMNHLTVIEVSEPVLSVAAGSPAFKVEWRENKVFIQPTEANTATNLFIWTSSQRFNYELLAAGPVEKMDFALDQVQNQSSQTHPAPAPAAVAPQQASTMTPPIQMLLASRPIRLESTRPSTRPVQILLRDLYESDGRLFIRYAIRNHGTEPYKTSAPQVYALNGAKYPKSLYDLVNRQLGDAEVGHLKISQQIPLQTVNNEFQASALAPGQETVGVIAVQAPPRTGPMVLRVEFAPDKKAEVAAFLVR
jgi:Conjugal transfer protein